MRRVTFPLVALAALLSACASRSSDTGEQPAPAPTATPSNQVLDQTFMLAEGEIVRLNLAAGVTYVAEIEGQGIGLRLQPRTPGVQKPLVQEALGGPSASNTRVFTIKPYADAEYELRTSGGTPGRAVRLRLYQRPSE